MRWRPKWRSEPEFPILFLGLDAAGKSTVLYGLKLGEVVTTVPTIGFNLETIERNGLKINCWDVGGCDKIRPLWRHFTEGCVAVVFVVDANDRERLAAARQELQDVLRDVASGVPVLVLANKQDLPNALPAAEVARLMWLAPPQPPLQQQQRHPTPEQAILTAQVSIASPASSGEGSCNDGGGSGADAAAAAGPAPGPRMSEEEWYFRDLISRHAVHVQPTCALRLFGVLEGFDWLASALDHARQQGSGSGGAANVNGSSNAGSSLGLLRAVMPAAWRSRRQARQRQQARQPTEQQQQQQQRSVIHRWAAVAMRGAAGGSHAYGASTGAATATKNTSSGGANVGGGGSGPVLPSAEERLSGWLAEPVAAGDSDDAFLASLEACEPGVRWDHFAHLRLAWLYLVRYGRSQGAARIFQAVQRYIQHGVAGGGGRTFHTTMTFFWMHMVHYALASSQLHTPMVRTSFRAFLIANPHLADSGLFLRHYSRARMLHDPAARTALLLPDLQPLPSLVTDVEARKREQAREKRVAVVAGAAAAAVVGTPRLLARAAGVAAGWGVRGDRSSGGGSVSLRREEDGVLSAAYRRSSTSSGSTSNSTRSGGRLRSDGGQRATAGAARGWHNRLPAAAAAATRDEDLLAAVLQHLPGRAAATATSGSLGQALPSSGLRQQAQGGSKVAVGLRHNYEGRGDGGVGHASSGSPSPSLLSGWGSDTLPRVAYAAIRHHGYARASELLQAAAAAAATTRGQASTEESSDGGTLESPPALAEAAAAASAETRPHVKRAGDLGSLLGMDVSQLQEVVRDVARGIAARLPTAPEPAPSAAAKSARALISVDVGDGKPRVGGGLKQGECSDDDEEEEEEEEWLNVGDHEAWGVVTALNDKALRVDGKDAELEKLVGSDRVPLMRAALPQYRLLFTSG